MAMQITLSLAAAAAAFLAAIMLGRVCAHTRWQLPQRASSLPIWLSLLWPIVSPLALAIGPRLSVEHRLRLQQGLQSAEIDMELSPQHWLASQWVVSIIMAVAVASCVSETAMKQIVAAFAVGSLTFWWTARWLADRRARVELEVLRELPLYLDLLTLAVEAGSSLTPALSLATEKGRDSALRRALQRALREMRAGRSRLEALTTMEQRLNVPTLTSMVGALRNAERTGASLGQVLRAQAEQRTAERFARAEKLAMEAPVKMLGPLITCIFPCTFIVIGFPIAMQLAQQFS
jgi:tight adherence protein C